MKEVIKLIKRYNDVDSWLRGSPNVRGKEFDLVCDKQKRRLAFLVKLLIDKARHYSFYEIDYRRIIESYRWEKESKEKFNDIYLENMKEFLPKEFIMLHNKKNL